MEARKELKDIISSLMIAQLEINNTEDLDSEETAIIETALYKLLESIGTFQRKGKPLGRKMTRNEAIAMLSEIRYTAKMLGEKQNASDDYKIDMEAFDIAIEALESQKHGHWIANSICSVCKGGVRGYAIPTNPNEPEYHICPICGAINDGKE